MKTSIETLKFVVRIDGADHVIDEISFYDTDQYLPWNVSCECCAIEGSGDTLEGAVRDFVEKAKAKRRSEEQDEYSSGL